MRILLILLLAFSFNTSVANTNGDTIEYFMSYAKQKCDPAISHYYRLAYKEGQWWRVKDFYVAQKTIQFDGIFSDSSFETGQGMHFEYHKNGKLQQKGRFIDGFREGMVKAYDTAGVLIDSGIYKKGIPIAAHYRWNSKRHLIFKGEYDMEEHGIGYEWGYFDDGTLSDFGKTTYWHQKDSTWTYFDRKGNICCKEYFDADSLIKRECYENGSLLTSSCEDTQPVFPGGEEKFYQVLNKYFNFPDNMRLKNGTVARVVVRFAVDIDGKISDVEVIQKFHPEFDREVLYAISKVPLFKPARMHNRTEKVYYTMPFQFSDMY